jgi:hypothetical protein
MVFVCMLKRSKSIEIKDKIVPSVTIGKSLSKQQSNKKNKNINLAIVFSHTKKCFFYSLELYYPPLRSIYSHRNT